MVHPMEHGVLNAAIVSMEYQKAGGIPLRRRGLSNQLRRQLIIELMKTHFRSFL
jgi:hypothetical protein